MLTVAVWLIANLAKSDAAGTRPLITIFLVYAIANAILSWKFFFAVPIILALGIAICLSLALVSTRRARAA